MATTTDINAVPEYNLQGLLEIDTLTPIPPSVVNQVLASPPFVPIPGILNLRDLSHTTFIRSGLLYRSGALTSLPTSSIALLKTTHNIKLILDLRTDREVARAPDPVIEGVENIWVPSTRAPSPINFQGFEGDAREGYKKTYEEVLEIYGASFREALKWLGDGKGPVLFHCSAGKDRTGVLAAIFLALAGAPKHVIAHDYALSRIGIEPGREELVAMMGSLNKDWGMETPGMKEFAQIKAEFMEAMLETLEEKYSGVEGYVRGLGFGDEDLERIRAVLRGEDV